MNNYTENAEYDKTFKLDENVEVAYLSKKKFKNLYPKDHGGYKILGAVGAGIKKKQGSWTFQEEEFVFYTLKYNRLFYGIDGYIEIGEDTYLAIVSRKLARFLLLLLLLLALLFGGVSLWNNRGPFIDPGSAKYKAPIKLSENYDSEKIAIPGYGDIKMEANTDTAYIALWNPDENPCYFIFTIIMDKSNDVIYKSGMIPPGNAVTKVKMDRKLAKGIYPITIRIDTYDIKHYKEKLNGGEVKTRIVSIEK